MRIFILIRISDAGRRAAVISGGNGAEELEIEIYRDSVNAAEFLTIMEMATINRNEAVVDLRGGLERDNLFVPIADFDWVPNVAEVSVVFRDARRELERLRVEEAARRTRLGLRPGDFDFPIIGQVLQRVPIHEKLPGGRNWMATVRPAPTAPGGLDRAWIARTQQQNDDDGYYRLRPLRVGEVIEFGADMMGSRDKRFKTRWYGYVVRHADNMLVLHKTATPALAFAEGVAYAASVAPPTPPPPAEPGIRRRRLGGYVKEDRPDWEL